MKLSEFLEGKDLFGAIDLANMDAPSLNSLLVFEYGRKTVFTSVLDLSIDTIANLIVTKLGDRWDDLIEAHLVLDNSLGYKKETTETITREEDKVSDRSDVDKTSAFNSDVMIENGGSSTTSSDGLIGETVKTVVDERIDARNAFNLLNLKSRQSIMQTVVSDVSSFLTLSIY